MRNGHWSRIAQGITEYAHGIEDFHEIVTISVSVLLRFGVVRLFRRRLWLEIATSPCDLPANTPEEDDHPTTAAFTHRTADLSGATSSRREKQLMPWNCAYRISSRPMPDTPTPSTPPGERFHMIDALRALAMFLGVVLHAALGLMLTANVFTPRMDRSRFVAFDIAVFSIHAFRMQLFFIVAGIFTGLLLSRRSPEAFVRGRLVRVALPLLVGALTVAPLTVWPFYRAMGGRWTFADLIDSPVHLWFLVVLSIFSAAAAVLAGAARRWMGVSRLGTWCGERLAAASISPWAVLIFVVPTTLLTLPMESWTIDTPGGWIPPWKPLVYYAFFFAIGWAIQRHNALAGLKGGKWRWPVLLIVGNIVVLPALLVVGMGVTPKLIEAAGASAMNQRLAILPAAAVQALYTWMMILGLFGLFLSWCGRPRPWLRWLADSSYWVYLVHLPAVYWLQYFLADVALMGSSPGPLEACIKFVVILSAATVFSLVTYALLVRPTILERVVGGGSATHRRHLPATPPAHPPPA